MSKPIPQHQLNTDSGVRSRAAQPLHLALGAIRKVPEVTVYFWMIKLLTTAMGESTSDYLVYQINPYVAVAAACLALLVRSSCSSWPVAMLRGRTGSRSPWSPCSAPWQLT